MRRVAGFTLVELMVVIVIVGVLGVGAIVLMPPGTGQLERSTAHRFQALYDLLYEEAMLQGGSRGLAVGARGYAFYRRLPGGTWERMAERPFSPRFVAAGYRFDLLLDGVEVELPAEPPDSPQLWLSPGGATRPFVLVLRRRDLDATEVRRFKVDSLGRRSWHAREA